MIKNIVGKLAITMVATLLISNKVQAVEIPLDEFLGDDEQIFSLSKKNERAFDAASATYIISSEDIRRSGVTSIPEALRLVPGLHVARQGSGKWAIASRGFNHQYSNKLLIMVDGRIVYTPVFSGTFWDIQDYILADIEKIEVVRGPGGTIWGANAVNGVINIITKDASTTTGGLIGGAVGNLDEYISSVRYGGKVNNDLFYRVYAKSSHRNDMKALDGDDSRDDWKNQRAGFRTDYYKSDQDTITVSGDIHKGEAENYFSIFPSGTAFDSIVDPNTKRSQGTNIMVKWEKVISKKSIFSLQSYVDYDKFNLAKLERNAYSYDIDFQHFYNITNDNQIAWGGGYRLIDDRMRSADVLVYKPDKRSDAILSAFIQDKITMLDETVQLVFGSKFEHNDYTGAEYQPNIKLTVFPSDDQTVWMGISRAVRTPTRGEDGFTLPLDDTGYAGSGYLALQGNTDYESEKLIAYELGYRIKPNKKMTFDIATFYNDYSNLQTFEFEPSDGTPAYGILNVANKGDANSYGIELDAKFDISTKWKVEAAASFIRVEVDTDEDSTDQNGGEGEILHAEEKNVPRKQFRLTSLYNINSKFELDNTVYYVDRIGEGDAVINSYVRVDAGLTYKPSPELSFSVIGQNLTDNTHQEYSKSLYSEAIEVPRSYHIRASYKF